MADTVAMADSVAMAGTAAMAGTTARAVLTPEALWTIPRVGVPRALADGRLLVPVTTYAEDDSSEVTVWRVAADGDHCQVFASGALSSLAVSPGSTSVAFLRPVAGYRQVHVQPLDGGEARQITDLPRGAVGVRWATEDRLVALAVLLAEHPTLEGTAEHEPDPHLNVQVTEHAMYRFWDSWLDEVYHPVAIDTENGDPIDLTPGSRRRWTRPGTDDPIQDIDISPDGSLVAFAADDSDPPHRETSWSVFVADIDGTSLRRIDPARAGNSRRPRFMPDGSGLVFGYRARPDFYADRQQLVLCDLDSGDHIDLAPGWDLSPDQWRPSGPDDLVVVAEHEGRSKLWGLRVTSGEVDQLTAEGWLSDPEVAPDGSVYVVAHSLMAPPEVYRLADGHLTPTTTFTAPALAGIELGSARELTIPGADSRPIQTWIVDPPGTGPAERLPLVHMIHGGPHGSFGDAWHWRWSPQVVAAAGHRVALVNFHGSTGWGSEFTSSILGTWGDRPYRDIEAATDHLIGSGAVDESRMAVTGGSYGGYLTAWITTRTDRYACAVTHAPVTNLAGMYSTDIVYGWSLATGAEVWEDPATTARWSPSEHASGYATPTLVTCGGRDYRVPDTQALELYGVLRAKGVPGRLVYYPEENHWILGRANSIRWYEEVLAWLDRWFEGDR